MFLTRIPLDLQNRKVMKALSSPGIFHGGVESMFEGERRRNLWRLDSLGGKLYILVLSEIAPNTLRFCEQFCRAGATAETKNCDKLLNGINNGDILRFRLVANPTFAMPNGEGRGKVCAHIGKDRTDEDNSKGVDRQKKWLVKKSETNGFLLDWDMFNTVANRWYRFYKNGSGGKPVTLLSVTYEGILEVTDAELFRKALVSGIGRGKAYGNGLMTVLHIKSNG